MFRTDSIIVDTLLNDEGNEEEASHLSLQDLTSLLVKTGFNFRFDESQNQVTEVLEATAAPEQAAQGEEEDLTEEIENLMLRLETVFRSYHDKTIVSTHQKQTQKEFGGAGELQQIVAEIADQIHSFSQALPARMPSVRSEGDGLSNPSPAPLARSNYAVTVNP